MKPLKIQVIIKSPSSYYGNLFKGKVQAVEPPFDSERQADRFIADNKKFDRKLHVAYRYYKRKV